jgi:uncharacterized beta-barrel protein YwiB (DUF1934 family)
MILHRGLLCNDFIKGDYMTKEVLLTISGLHYDSLPDEDENEPIEVITPATYYLKNGKHYVIYDEMVEGMPGTIQNKIRIAGNNLLEIKKSGLANTKMVFERDKINMTQYETPYGELLIGIFTKNMQVDVTEKNIDVCVNYELDINSEKVANCDIKMNIRANAPG